MHQLRTLSTRCLSLFFMAGLMTWSAHAEILQEGAALGKWTMDYEAGIEIAKEKNLAVFLEFTGSDWCGWCKLMDRKVFSQDEWSDFAATKLSLIKIDFPRKTKLADKMKKRNRGLQRQFGVGGFPTYVLLDSDGATELARLGAGRDKTPESFIKEVEHAIRRSSVGIDTVATELPPKRAKHYRNLVTEHRNVEKELDKWLQSRPDSSKKNVSKFTKYNDELTRLSIQIEQLEAEALTKEMPAEKAEEYMALMTDLHAAKNELNDWLRTKPPRNDENENKRDEMQAKIRKLTKQMSRF